MTTPLIEKLNITSSVSIVIISISLMLFGGFAMTRITKRLKLPNTDLLDCTDKQQLLGEPGCRAEAVKAVRGICILPEYEQGYREAQCLDCG